MIGMTYADKIAKLCEQRGWDQAALHRAVRIVSKTTVSNWWNGQSRPDMDTALTVARVLGVPLDYLADDSQEHEPAGLETDEVVALDVYRELRAELGAAKALRALSLAMVNKPELVYFGGDRSRGTSSTDSEPPKLSGPPRLIAKPVGAPEHYEKLKRERDRPTPVEKPKAKAESKTKK